MKRRRLVSRWLPVTLRWRRPRPHLPAMRMQRAAPSLTLHARWSAHVHLHFAGAAQPAGSRSAPPRLAPAATIHRTQHVVVAGPATNVRHLVLATRVHRAYAGPLVVQHATRTVAPVTLLRSTSRLATRSTIVAGERATLSLVMRRDIHTATLRRERVQSMERAHARELQSFRQLISTRTELVHRRLPERVTAPAPIVRPAEIVWRRETRYAQTITEAAAGERAISSSRSVPLESLERSLPPAAALQAARLDLDRLTDDVIRRVERRARIERERRGL